MDQKTIYHNILEASRQRRKQFAILVDPDGVVPDHFDRIISLAEKASVDYFLVGGSLIMQDRLDYCIRTIREKTQIPSVLFPGNAMQVHPDAKALLFLSLISGRNPDFLIGQHVVAAPQIRDSGLEVIPTGYLLVNGGQPSSVSYMSNTVPIPRNKCNIALSTALAGKYLGLKMIYLDAGSGAKEEVPPEMIQTIKTEVGLPLVVGGGIRDAETMYQQAKAGADLLVVGTAIEKDPGLIIQMSQALEAATSYQKSRL